MPFDHYDFKRQENVESWLSHTPRELELVFAARAALRSAPVLISSIDRLGGVAKAGPAILLPTFRAMAAAWVATRYPAQRREMRIAAAATAADNAAKAADAYAVSGGANVARAAAYSARAVVEAEDFAVIQNTSQLAAEAVWNAVYAVRTHGPTDDRDRRAIKFTDALSADAAEIDAARLEQIHATIIANDLATKPLWLQGTPPWASTLWEQIEQALDLTDADWQAWTAWYRARLEGGASNEALEIARVLTPKDVWESGPKAVNAYLNHLKEEYEKPVETVLPPIPAQRPAAMEPIWVDNRLTLRQTPANVDLSPPDLTASMLALRRELYEFADDVENEANIDRRFPLFVRRLSERIPDSPPLQHDLFRLGHAEAVFAGFSKTVEDEWPTFLAARYHALSLQFDRTMRQFPVWRDFKRNAARQDFTSQQIATAVPLAAAGIVALRNENASTFVDPLVPKVLEQLSEPLKTDKLSRQQLEDALEAGMDDLAFDVVESFNNILKRIAEAALASMRVAGLTVGKAGHHYSQEFEIALVQEAGKLGKNHGQSAVKWLNVIFIGGASYALASLVAAYPKLFGWLSGVIRFLASHSPI